MRIKELKKLIENLPDDAELLVPSGDHSYRKADAMYVEVEHLVGQRKRDYFLEWYGEEHSSGGKPEKHLVIE